MEKIELTSLCVFDCRRNCIKTEIMREKNNMEPVKFYVVKHNCVT